MESIGDVLRNERLRRDLSLNDIADECRISKRYLEAIEGNQFDLLPGGLFTRSFLRQYARLLELDEDQLIASYRMEFEEGFLPLPLPQKKRTLKLRIPRSISWLVVTILASGTGYTLWQNVHRTVAKTQTVAITPHDFVQYDAGERAANSFDPSIQPASPHAPAVAALPVPQQQPAPAMHIVFTAAEPVWLSIQADEKRVFNGTLSERGTKELDASSKVTALVGNAGGLTVSLNGKSIGVIGGHGEVRVVELTPAGSRVHSEAPAVAAFPPEADSAEGR